MGIAALNARHGDGRADRFFLFHRLRQWNEREGLWMGWERKRGKIEEFNRLLRGATDTSFVVSVGDLSILPQVKYCITLDSDTRLPRGVARELIGIIIHPLNRAAPSGIAGWPCHRRIHPAAAHQRHIQSAAGSLFARLYAGHTGVDPHSRRRLRHMPGPLQRRHLHRQGSMRRRCVHRRAPGLGPRKRALSHDLFEGLYARVALVSTWSWSTNIRRAPPTHDGSTAGFAAIGEILLWLFPFVPRGTACNGNPCR